jgi:hypothetical protein
MRRHHYTIRLILVHAEHGLENSDNESARRVIIVEQNDLVELRPLRFRLKLDPRFDQRVRHRISELSIESNARDSRCSQPRRKTHTGYCGHASCSFLTLTFGRQTYFDQRPNGFRSRNSLTTPFIDRTDRLWGHAQCNQRARHSHTGLLAEISLRSAVTPIRKMPILSRRGVRGQDKGTSLERKSRPV